MYAVERTERASSMVVVVKKDNTLRLCIDPSRTFNPWLVKLEKLEKKKAQYQEK